MNNNNISLGVRLLSWLYFPSRFINRIRIYFGRKTYLNDSLVCILDLLPGRWCITEYAHVHHGWTAIITRLDLNTFLTNPEKYFLHSEEGSISVFSCNATGNVSLGCVFNNTAEVANIIKGKMA